MTILLVDDHAIYLNGLKDLFQTISKVSEVITAENANEAINIINTKKIDLVITDIGMPDISGAELFEQALTLPNTPKFAFNSMYLADDYIKRYLNTGYLVGYFTKCTSLEELKTGIDVICDDGIYFCERLHKVISRNQGIWSLVNQEEQTLTKAEEQVLKEVCKQQSSREIAEKLFLSEHTVKNHRKHIKQKLNINHTAGLIVYAIKTGLFVVE
jgi:DNA-binding NarL/FixJ family response regulator